MRIFIAGATGAVGSRLVPLLVEAGHTVIGSTRREAGCDAIRARGAAGIVMDPLSAESVLSAVADARPDVIVHELTALGELSGNLKRWDQEFAMTNRLRTEGTDHLLAAAHAHGVRRFLAQSFGGGWAYDRTGSWVKNEDDPLIGDPGKEARESLRAIRHLEDAVTAASGIEGVVLRYGNFYGPGNATSRDGALADLLRAGKMPVVGSGTGVWSFIHIDDVGSATVAAVERGAPGIYNIVDDEPAPVHDWLPHLSKQVGGKEPKRLPTWMARPIIGQFGTALMTTVRGSCNAKAKRELNWTPTYATWREGFITGIG